MNHTIIIIITSALTSVISVICSLLTLHILFKIDKKRRNRNVEREKLIITPLPIKKVQNNFPVVPAIPKDDETIIILDSKNERGNNDENKE